MHDREREIVEQLRAVVVELDEGGRLTYVGPSVQDLLGYAPEEILRRPGFDWIHDEDRDRMVGLFRQALEKEQSVQTFCRARHKSGHWVWLEASGRPCRAADGSLRAVAIARDVSDLVRMGQALGESEDRFETLAANARDLILELDARGRYLYVSPNCESLLGVPVDTLLGHDMHEPHISHRIHPDDRKRVLRRFAARIAETGPGTEQYRYRHADGSWRWFETRAGSYRSRDGEQRVVVVARDVTDRLRAEAELRESDERHRVLAEATSDWITELDAEGRLVYASPLVRELLGYEPEELIGTTPVALLLHPDEAESACRSFLENSEKQGPLRSAPYRMRHRDGSWRWFESTGVSYRRADGQARVIAVTRDVTERLQAEQQRQELEARIQQAQKFESLGVMAGGIAHDFNNLLTPILGDSSLALMDLPPGSPLRDRLLRVHKAAHRAAALTSQMLAYAGKRPLLVEPVHLSRLVLEMSELLESVVGHEATLSFALERDLPPIEGDVSQLCQLVMNLLSNAAEALGERGGRIEIRTGSTDSRRAARGATLFGWDLRPGPCSYLEVGDNGCGMAPATLRRIFDPFFSTKFTGRGLGLAAVMGIARGHRAAFEIESGPGRGTRIRVIFPEARPTRAAVPSAPPEDWRGSGSVLVVDDEQGVRELVQGALERAGLAVVCTGDGRRALEAFREEPDGFDLVLLDGTLPGAGGDATFDALQAVRPEVPVLLMSGFREELATARFAGRELAGFLQKPFEPGALVERVRAVLERAHS